MYGMDEIENALDVYMSPTTNIQTRYDRIIDESKPHEFYYYPARGYGKTIELENIHVHNGNLYGNINNGAELIQAIIQESKPSKAYRLSFFLFFLSFFPPKRDRVSSIPNY